MTGMPGRSVDERRVQRAAWRVALAVGIGSIAIVAAILLVIVVVVLAESRPDERPGRHSSTFWTDRIVGVGDVVPIVVVLGVLGIVALSAIAWIVARRSARPLAEALRVQRAFVADASHELRTPLTTLTSRVQLAIHRAERDGDVVGALQDVKRDAAVLDAVLTDLLLAAEAAGGAGPGSGAAGSPRAAASVSASAVAAADTLHLRAVGAQVAIELDVPPDLVAAIDAAALSRAIVALLDNAVRHSPPGAAVTVAARRVGDVVEVRVIDRGSGIRGADPGRLFDRFVRADDADRATPQRGFGLGLAIVRDIADRFGGTVRVEHTSAAGTTFLLRIPPGPRV